MEEQSAKYQKVMNWIKENIANGNWKEGDRLPSEQEMSSKFSLSRQTIRHATGVLVREGVLKRVRGSGTYVGKGAAYPSQRVRHMNIAVISTYVDSYIFPPTIMGIERVLAKAGYTTQMSFTNDQIRHERSILEKLIEKDNIDGIIVEASKGALPNPNLKYYKQLMERKIPILFFNAKYPELDVPVVRIDDSEVAGQMTQILLDAGHTQIGALMHAEDEQGRLRYGGYIKAITDAKIHHDPKHVLWIDAYSIFKLKEMEEVIFERLKGCTAVLCYNDEVAYQLIEMATERGIRVPEDLAVVGIDDANIAQICSIPITTTPHPKDKLGEMVANNLLQMIEDPYFDGNYLFHGNPIFRESVKKSEDNN